MDSGWPFLVASGLHRDYRTLLAPTPLVDSLDYGVLDTVAPPMTSRIIDVTTARGRQLSIAAASHLLAASDLGTGNGTKGSVRDEHGRPLRLIYGFACLDGRVVELDDIDLEQALTTALDTYRRFLADEDRLAVEASAPFPLRSRTAGWPVPMAHIASVASGRDRTAVVLVAAVIAASVLGAGLAIGWDRSGPSPTACPSVSARAGSPSPSPLPSPSCGPRR
jgi:hypothetical protein